MFLDKFANLMDIEYVNENLYDDLYFIYKHNMEFMRNTNLKNGYEVYKFHTDDAADLNGERAYFIVKIDKMFVALVDLYIGCPDEDSVYIKYFIVDKTYHTFELDLEIMRDLKSLALKEYKNVYIECPKSKTDLIKILNRCGFKDEESISDTKIRLKAID